MGDGVKKLPALLVIVMLFPAVPAVVARKKHVARHPSQST